MSRTFRRKIGSSEIIKDGDKQYAVSSCRHHGGCDYCKNNRTFEKAVSLEDELELLAQDVPENSLQKLTDEDLFVLGVQDFLCNRRSDKKSEPIDTSGTFEEFYERMRKRDEILLSRGQNLQTCYTIQGTTQEEIFEELTDLQRKVRKEQGLDIQEI